MPELATDAAEITAPRKPVNSADNDLVSVPLMLLVTDRDTATELLQKGESERNEYALSALRIGVLALKHARGQVDVDAVRREGEILLKDLRSTLEHSRTELHGNVTASLKEYFDPQNGRFQERIDRLIKQDGELEQVLRRQVGGDGSELARTFASHMGASSPLLRMLNPKESDGLVAAIRATSTEVSEREKARILKESSLDQDGSALKRLVGELTTANGQLKAELAGEVSNVTKA